MMECRALRLIIMDVVLQLRMFRHGAVSTNTGEVVVRLSICYNSLTTLSEIKLFAFKNGEVSV